MPSKIKITKRLSNLNILDRLEEKTTAPPQHFFSKAVKKKKPEKPLVFKANVPNPDSLNCYPHLVNTPSGLVVLAALKSHMEKNPHSLFIDVVLNEYINFMDNKSDKSRIVLQDQTEELMGKTATYIPGLKTFACILPDFKYEEIKSDGLLPNDEHAILKIVQLLLSTQDHYKTLRTFANCCVRLKRLDVDDFHLNNIAVDQFGNIVLFDLERGLSNLQDLVNVEEVICVLDFKAPLQQAVDNFFQMILDTEKTNFFTTFQQLLGPLASFFEACIFKAWLQEMLCPDEFIMKLTEIHSFPEVWEYAALSKEFLIETKVKLKAQCLEDKYFLKLLLRIGNQTMEEIIRDFKDAQKFHKHYVDNDENIANMDLQRIRDEYLNLVEDVQKSQISLFIQAFTGGAILNFVDQKQLLFTLRALDSPQCAEERVGLLKRACRDFPHLFLHPNFNIAYPHCQKIVNVFTYNPLLMYKVLLASFYTNNNALIQLLLPMFLKLKNAANEPYHEINGVDQFGKTLLHHAIDAYSLTAAKILLVQGARIDSTLGTGRTIGLSIYSKEAMDIEDYAKEHHKTELSTINDTNFLGITIAQWRDEIDVIDLDNLKTHAVCNFK